MLRPCLLAGLAVVALAAPSSATATVFCVDGPPNCPSGGTNVDGANMETEALQGPTRSDGQADAVYIDDGTFTAPNGFDVNGTDALEMIGVGIDDTILTASDSGNLTVLGTAGAGEGQVTVRNLMIRIPDSFDAGGTGARARGDVFESVRIRSLNANGSDAFGLFADSTFRNSVIDAEGAGLISYGIRSNNAAGTMLVENSSIAGFYPVLTDRTDAPLTVRGSLLASTGGVAVHALFGATATLENVVIRTNGASAMRAFGGDPGTSLITANHVTAVPLDAGAYRAVSAQVNPGSNGGATVEVRNSILRGFDSAYTRGAPVAGADGDANVTILHSNFTKGASQDSGDGAADVDSPTNIDADPRFLSATNLRIGADSPSIDRGDPAAGGPATDLDGNPRVNDGNRDRTAVRDQGAFEFQAAPPDPLPPGDTPPGTTPPGTTPPGTTPPPPPPLATFGTRTLVRLASVRITRRGVALVRIRNDNTFAVTGSVELRSRRAVAAQLRRNARLGRRALRIPARATRTVRVKLSRAARRTLRARRRVAVSMVARVRAPSGAVRTVRRSATLRRRR